MLKTTLLGAAVAAFLPIASYAAPSFQPAAAAVVANDESARSATTDTQHDADGIVRVREGGTRGRGRP